jgi:hypothetical protein
MRHVFRRAIGLGGAVFVAVAVAFIPTQPANADP